MHEKRHYNGLVSFGVDARTSKEAWYTLQNLIENIMESTGGPSDSITGGEIIVMTEEQDPDGSDELEEP